MTELLRDSTPDEVVAIESGFMESVCGVLANIRAVRASEVGTGCALSVQKRDDQSVVVAGIRRAKQWPVTIVAIEFDRAVGQAT